MPRIHNHSGKHTRSFAVSSVDCHFNGWRTQSPPIYCATSSKKQRSPIINLITGINGKSVGFSQDRYYIEPNGNPCSTCANCHCANNYRTAPSNITSLDPMTNPELPSNFRQHSIAKSSPSKKIACLAPQSLSWGSPLTSLRILRDRLNPLDITACQTAPALLSRSCSWRLHRRNNTAELLRIFSQGI